MGGTPGWTKSRIKVILKSMLALALLLVTAPTLHAEIIHLKNGNQLEGIIIKKTNTQITLDFGYGSTVLDRADISRIQGADQKQAAVTAKKIRHRQYETGNTVPEGGEKYEKLYREVHATRKSALDSRRLWRELNDEAVELEGDLPALKEDYITQAAHLDSIDAGSDPVGFNRQVAAANKAGRNIQAAEFRLEAIDRLQAESNVKIQSYLGAHQQLKSYIEGEGAAWLKQAPEYGEWLRDEIKSMAGDFRRNDIRVEKKGNSIFVNVLLNNKTSARLLVDTGASTSLLFKEIVTKLNPAPNMRVGKTAITVADGRTAEVDLIRLESMSIGQFRVRNVLVASSPLSSQGFDGLLGMTFLGQFIVRFDPAHGRIILEDLK